MGDSITEFWRVADPIFFHEKTLDRGISGQTSSQITLRFYTDVVQLHPLAVHLLVGTNDVAQNTGPISHEDFLSNIRTMVDLAQINHIKVVLASITPAKAFPWRPNISSPADRITRLNAQLRLLAKERKLMFVDYYSILTDGQGGLRDALSNDGVHPNRDGYALMRPVAEKAIAAALHTR